MATENMARTGQTDQALALLARSMGVAVRD